MNESLFKLLYRSLNTQGMDTFLHPFSHNSPSSTYEYISQLTNPQVMNSTLHSPLHFKLWRRKNSTFLFIIILKWWIHPSALHIIWKLQIHPSTFLFILKSWIHPSNMNKSPNSSFCHVIMNKFHSSPNPYLCSVPICYRKFLNYHVLCAGVDDLACICVNDVVGRTCPALWYPWRRLVGLVRHIQILIVTHGTWTCVAQWIICYSQRCS